MALATVIGLILLAVVLWDIFETIILPRRVTHRFRLTRFFYRHTWTPWSRAARLIRKPNLRESFLGFFGPLSLLVLFALWAVGLIVAFAFLHYGAGSAINSPIAPISHPGFRTDLYLSGTTFFTLGLGDVTPRTELARVITVIESGLGLGFLAMAVSYLPVLYGAFSRREVNISLLDARAGSPPTAAELLRRHAQPKGAQALEQYLRDWESWAAELMESHLSYPVLCLFRSQHNNQSWLAALSTILDVSALLIAHGAGSLRWQAKLTFAISRHAVVDLAQVLSCPPMSRYPERLPAADLQKLRALLAAAKLAPCCEPQPPEQSNEQKDEQKNEQQAGRQDEQLEENRQRLADLRRMYEPYVAALSKRLQMPVGAWAPARQITDNWRTSAWARISADLEMPPLAESEEAEHF